MAWWSLPYRKPTRLLTPQNFTRSQFGSRPAEARARCSGDPSASRSRAALSCSRAAACSSPPWPPLAGSPSSLGGGAADTGGSGRAGAAGSAARSRRSPRPRGRERRRRARGRSCRSRGRSGSEQSRRNLRPGVWRKGRSAVRASRATRVSRATGASRASRSEPGSAEDGAGSILVRGRRAMGAECVDVADAKIRGDSSGRMPERRRL